jgi:hypothetical protein
MAIESSYKTQSSLLFNLHSVARRDLTMKLSITNAFPCCKSAKALHMEDTRKVSDKSAKNLSHVGHAAYEALRKAPNSFHHHSLWNVTSGHVVDGLYQTPRNIWDCDTDLPDGHDDWLPEKMGEILARTEYWADVMSLDPPDGLFLESFKKALKAIIAKNLNRNVIVRMMFGNILGMPVDCSRVIKKLTEGLPEDAKLHLWVGAWRRGVSWNHAKLIAVDGRYLHTVSFDYFYGVAAEILKRFSPFFVQGGHNLYHDHYLTQDPLHDISFELEGRCAYDGHLYANDQWRFIKLMQRTPCGYCINKMPDNMETLTRSRVTVSEFPHGVAPVFPPKYIAASVPKVESGANDVPIITMGRYGKLLPFSRPSDDAFIAMLLSATKTIRLALQDLGPVCIPGTKMPLPGVGWPKKTLAALGKVIWENDVEVMIALCNPGSST